MSAAEPDATQRHASQSERVHVRRIRGIELRTAFVFLYGAIGQLFGAGESGVRSKTFRD
jgi:hypothetical protein